jgi:hypothetical protein
VDDHWYCAIEADSEKIKNVGKVWIPKETTMGGTIWPPKKLWHKGEDVLLSYAKSIVPEEPEKALRFSEISHTRDPMLQMVIPTEAINKDEFDFWAQCWETEYGLLKFSTQTVDWMSWDIAGRNKNWFRLGYRFVLHWWRWWRSRAATAPES